MNPEFKRNLWLEVTPTRMAVMPTIVVLIALAIWLAMKDFDDAPHVVANTLISSFATLCGLFLLLWGASRVLTGIDSEIQERTWDGQRLSALSPWQMAWGKLLGPAIQPWYGGLLCAAVILLAAASKGELFGVLRWLGAGLLGALALHAVLLALRVYTLDPQRVPRHGAVSRVLILLFVLMTFTRPLLIILGGAESFEWWDLGLSFGSEMLLLSALVAALAMLALWRAMCRTLLVRTTPWAWVLGCLALTFILSGMSLVRQVHGGWTIVLGCIALFATYFALLLERNSRLDWEALFYHLRRGSLRRALEILPLWLPGLLLALVAIPLFTPYTARLEGIGEHLLALAWLVWLHALRDCGIYLFFAWSRRGRSPLVPTLLTLFVLGLLLPGLLINVEPELITWFEPLYPLLTFSFLAGGETPPEAWWASLLHVAVVAALLVWRWRSR